MRTEFIRHEGIRRFLRFIERLKRLSFYSDRMYFFSRFGLARSEDTILDPYSLKSFGNNLRYAYKVLGIV